MNDQNPIRQEASDTPPIPENPAPRWTVMIRPDFRQDYFAASIHDDPADAEFWASEWRQGGYSAYVSTYTDESPTTGGES